MPLSDFIPKPGGRRRMAADFEAERAGRMPSDQGINDDFASRLMRDAEAAQRAAPRQGMPPDTMSPAARRAIEAAETPAQKQKYVHETDINNWRSIKQGGIRPSTGGGAMGNEGVYAYEGGAQGRRVPEGRALIEFEADPRRVAGRGTTPGSRTRLLGGGPIEAVDITGVYGSSGRLASVLGGTPHHGLYSLIAGMLGLPDIRTPADWVMERLLTESDISPYRQQPVTYA